VLHALYVIGKSRFTWSHARFLTWSLITPKQKRAWTGTWSHGLITQLANLNIVQFNALETWARTPCCGPRRSARRPSYAAPNGTRLAASQSGAPPTFAASMATAATAACASAAAAVLQRRWCRDFLAAVLLRTSPLSRPLGETTRLPLQPVWRRVVREGCQGSTRSLIDLFHTAPTLVTMMATRLKGVLHDHEASRFVENGCYLCVFTPPKGRDLGVIGRDRAWHAHTPRVGGREIQAYLSDTIRHKVSSRISSESDPHSILEIRPLESIVGASSNAWEGVELQTI